MNSRLDRDIEDLKAKQRNTVFPDTTANGRNVDAFLWKGSPDAPLVQRVGAWIFGLFFLLAGVACFGMAQKSHSWADIIYSLGGFLIGGKVFLNGFRRRKVKTNKGN